MMTKRIIFGVLLAAMIVVICSCKKDNAQCHMGNIRLKAPL